MAERTCDYDDCTATATVVLDMDVFDDPKDACPEHAKNELYADPDNTDILERYDTGGRS